MACMQWSQSMVVWAAFALLQEDMIVSLLPLKAPIAPLKFGGVRSKITFQSIAFTTLRAAILINYLIIYCKSFIRLAQRFFLNKLFICQYKKLSIKQNKYKQISICLFLKCIFLITNSNFKKGYKIFEIYFICLKKVY